MQGGTKARTGAYEAVREDAGLKFQRRRRPLSTDQGTSYYIDKFGGGVVKGSRYLWPGLLGILVDWHLGNPSGVFI